MEKWARRAFVNSCCNQNCQGMFAIELPEVSKAQHTAHHDDDDTEVAPSTSIEMPETATTTPDTLKYMRRRKVRGSVFIQNAVCLVFMNCIFLMGKRCTDCIKTGVSVFSLLCTWTTYLSLSRQKLWVCRSQILEVCNQTVIPPRGFDK
jgi:hypothetical protein